jgi:nucleoside-diphosphate-sugar epimerase
VILLVGRRGNLSLSIQKHFADEEILVIGSEIASDWCEEDGLVRIGRDTKRLGIDPTMIVNAAGLVNPRTNSMQLRNVNYILPRNLQLYSRDQNIKLVTFGTILENFIDVAYSNNYLSSKREFFEHLQKWPVEDANFLHLQIHTWYGVPKPHPHMFLSQLLYSIMYKGDFAMTSGEQVREYHHIDDDMGALRFLLDSQTNGIVQLSHGESMSLKEMAALILENYSMKDLLQIGKLETPVNEKFNYTYKRNTLLSSISFRDSVSGITDYFDELLGKNQ